MKNTSKKLHSDRFIPIRSLSVPKMPIISRFKLDETCSQQTKNTTAQSAKISKQLAYSTSINSEKQTVFDFLNTLQNSFKTKTTSHRPLTVSCSKIFDIPNVVDNFYYNPLDISMNDFLGIGLANQLFMFREADNFLIKFDDSERDDLISCVKFDSLGQALFVGRQRGILEVNDVAKAAKLRMIRNHFSRIGRIQTNSANMNLIFTGSKDFQIHLNDLRIKHACTSKLISHKSQVCGLTLKQNLLASGANDGSIKIWDIRNEFKLLDTFNNHQGAVKALTWCPWRTNVLVSGGGRKDQKIIVLDTLQKKIQKQIQTNHQVTDICWRNSTQQIIYSYTGKDNKGSIKVDNYFNPKCQKKKLSSHQGRILTIKVNKNNDNMIYSIGADECLKYWDLDSVSNKVELNDIVHNHLVQRRI